MSETTASKIAIDDLVEAAASGVLRALNARDVRANELVQSGFAVNILVVAGGIPGVAAAQQRVALNPQPLPP